MFTSNIGSAVFMSKRKVPERTDKLYAKTKYVPESNNKCIMKRDSDFGL